MGNLVDARVDASQTRIEALILDLLEEITQDWDIGKPTATTELGSLGLESINLVYLIAELQAEYGLEDALIARLRRDRIDVRLLRVDEMAGLVHELRQHVVHPGGAS
jgi:acyl carrier protein